MVVGLPCLETTKKICTTCLVGKQHKDFIPKKSVWRATRRLQLIQSDICGPIKPISHGGKRYFLTFIDYLTRKTWAYFLHQKSKAFASFKNFKVSVEKETGAFITYLRTYWGGEFNSNESSKFCKYAGISWQLTTTYTPQQNGVSKRKDRTIMNAVYLMLTERQVPRAFWSEAVRWCVHIQNRSPTVALKNKTPENHGAVRNR